MTYWVVVAAATILALAACSGTGPGQAEDHEEDAGTVAEFLGIGVERDESERERRVQEAIRVCMANAGFVYRPVDYSHVSTNVEWDEEKWARTWGFAITTTYGREAELRAMEQAQTSEEWVDPNHEIVDALSDIERDAWFEALNGDPADPTNGSHTEIDPVTGESNMVIEGGWDEGCQGEAYQAEFGATSANRDVWWEELAPDMDALYERVNADPRIVKLQKQWSVCMAAAGYDYASNDEMTQRISDDLYRRLEAIVGPDGFPDPFAGWSSAEIDRFHRDSTQEQIDALYQRAEEQARHNVDMEAVAALQQEEVNLAIVDFECRSDYREIYQDVAAEYETEFIALNRDRLEHMRDSPGG